MEISDLLQTIERLREENARLHFQLENYKDGETTVEDLWGKDLDEGFYLSAEEIERLFGVEIFEDAREAFEKATISLFHEIDKLKNERRVTTRTIKLLRSDVVDLRRKMKGEEPKKKIDVGDDKIITTDDLTSSYLYETSAADPDEIDDVLEKLQEAALYLKSLKY